MKVSDLHLTPNEDINHKYFFTGEEHLTLLKIFFLMVIRESDEGMRPSSDS